MVTLNMRTYKTLFILSVTALAAGCKTAQKAAPVKTEFVFKVQVQEKYCGGARISDEMRLDFEKQKPFRNGDLVLVNDARKDSVRLFLNADGSGRLTLQPALYKVFFAEKTDTPDRADMRSCPEWKLRADTIIDLVPGPTLLELQLYKGCNPCLPPRP